jgi:hypothetical protein
MPQTPNSAQARLSQAMRVLAENPFRILGVSPQASAREVEREGEKLLALIAAGLDDPLGMAPLGERSRSAEQVRWAMAQLRDPHRRALHEFFWPACESLPIDLARLEALLDRVPQAAPGEATLGEVLQDLAGELVPPPPPFTLPPALSAKIEALLAMRPRAARAPELCPDALDLNELFPIPRKDDPHGEG